MEFYRRVRFVFRLCCRIISMVTFYWILPMGTLVHILVACMSGIQICSAIDYQSTLDPKFIDTPTNRSFFRGELAILQCSVQHLGTKSVIWRKTSEPNPLTIGTVVFDPDPRYSVNHLKYRGQWDLYIKNVSKKDAGLYECQVSSKQRNIRRVILLKVTEPTPETPIPTVKNPILIGNHIVPVGSRFVLNCNATQETGTYATNKVDWFKDGKKITSQNEHIRITTFTNIKVKHSVLEIENARSDDAGVYVCRTSAMQVTDITVQVLSEEEMRMKDDPTARKEPDKRGADTEMSTETKSQAARNNSIFIFVFISSLLYSLLHNINIR